MSGVNSLVLTISLVCSLSQANRNIKTSPTQQTKTTYLGKVYKTDFGFKHYITAKFLGIPFALPPKRFDKPLMNTPKDEIFNATSFGPICPQIINPSDSCNREQIISENCLFLNIYVPLPTVKPQDLVHKTNNNTSTVKSQFTAPSPDRTDALLLPPGDTKLAVFIFVHGGAYVVGNGNCYDGSVLAGFGNIIVVTINYRLGHLGFLSTNDDVIPGNLGLQDQYVAFQWVKQNIEAFGGDPDRITVGGQSAGSYSSIYQALYEGNKGVFHRVIAQSGTPVAVKSASAVGYNITLEVAKQLNCNITGTKQEMKSCLMDKSANSIVNVRPPIIVPGSLPVQATVDYPFVTEDPNAILSQTEGYISSVPQHFISKDMLIGVDAQDGEIVLRLYIDLISRGKTTLYHQLLRSFISPEVFKEYIRYYFQKDYKDVVDESLVEAVFDRYVDWEKPNDYLSLSHRVIDMLTDVFFTIPSLDTAAAHVRWKDQTPISTTDTLRSRTNAIAEEHGGIGSERIHGSTFVYSFNVPNLMKSDIPWFDGTEHGSEVAYVFGKRWLKDERDLQLGMIIMTYWSNFIKSGDPNRDKPLKSRIRSHRNRSSHPTSQLPYWHEYNNHDEQYLEISAYPITKTRMRASYRHFWTHYIPTLRHRLQKVFSDGAKSEYAQKCMERKSNGQDILRVNILVSMVQVGLVSMFL